MLGLFLGKDEEKHCQTRTLRGTQHAKLFLLASSLASEILGFKLAGEVGFGLFLLF